jgi:hypothetical protein
VPRQLALLVPRASRLQLSARHASGRCASLISNRKKCSPAAENSCDGEILIFDRCLDNIWIVAGGGENLERSSRLPYHFTAACDRYLKIRRPDRKPGGVTVDCVVMVGHVIKVRVQGPWSPRASAPIDNSGAAVSIPITSHDLAIG